MMEVATPTSLARSSTAPAIHSKMQQHNSGSSLKQNHSSSSQFSIYSHPSSRLSDTTQGTSASTLFAPPPLPGAAPNGGPVEATNNVINRVADKESSLFQMCINLRQRLKGVPGLEEQILELEEQDADEDTDPVTLLWWTFRKGFPLMTLYNALRPASPLEIDSQRLPESKRGKAATFKFLQACVNDLKFATEDCFILTDLYGDDTGGFVKVAKVVNRVLDILAQEGLLQNFGQDDSQASSQVNSDVKRTQRQHIVDELVKTERTYVQHLELLQSFKTRVEERGLVSGDVVHDIFLNLTALLDFQRRFLIRVEQTNAQPESEQNWGKLFKLYSEAFKVYEPYIANQRRCETTAQQHFDKLREVGGSLEMRQMVESPTILSSFLLKPFQRLAKYPLLLMQLRDKGDLDEDRKRDLSEGIEAASAVLDRSNAAVDEEERKSAVLELKNRVEDWKGHRVEVFGDLLLYGTYTVLKGDTPTSRDTEREYKVYLFESILLCCKEINLNKQKNKIINKSLVDRKGKPKLQLKGRIFMQNVTETVSLSKPGSHTCQIFWKGDPGIENFMIRFQSEETMKKWAAQVDAQRRLWRDRSRISSDSRQGGTSETEFMYLQNQGALENPYREDGDEDDQVVDPAVRRSQLSVSRTGSDISLRSRSTTGDSGASIYTSRAAPPRFPVNYGAPPLNLRTQQLAAAPSPGEKPSESYFSPSLESPKSTRTSSSSGVYPFPRQQVPSNTWQRDEQNSRFTAPAMARQQSRDTQNGFPSYNPSTRAQRPSMQATPSSQSTITQSRLRSASSPDIQNAAGVSRRYTSGSRPTVPDEPLPPFPDQYSQTPNPMTRSQTSSPKYPPYRPSTGRQSSVSHRRERSLGRHPQADTSQYRYTPDIPPTDARVRSMAPTSTRLTTEFKRISPTPLSATTPRTMENLLSPTQLKVKVHCPSAGCTYTLVVAINISYQSLKDRIDAKLQRSTNVTLSSGGLKLKYLDDEDFVSIESDEDVQTAFEAWREQNQEQIATGQLGEIELYCQR